jgi:hypothetical protein
LVINAVDRNTPTASAVAKINDLLSFMIYQHKHSVKSIALGQQNLMLKQWSATYIDEGLR